MTDGRRDSGRAAIGRTLVVLDGSACGQGAAEALMDAEGFGKAIIEWRRSGARFLAAWADGDGGGSSGHARDVPGLAGPVLARAFEGAGLTTEAVVATSREAAAVVRAAVDARCIRQRARRLEEACPVGCVGICLSPEDGAPLTAVVEARTLDARMRAEARRRDGWIEGMRIEELEHARRTLHAEASDEAGRASATAACLAAAWLTLRQPSGAGMALADDIAEMARRGPAWISAATSADGDWCVIMGGEPVDASPALRWGGSVGPVEEMIMRRDQRWMAAR